MLSDKIIEADILIEGNKIKKIEKNINEDASKLIDAKGMLVMPGFVNCHSHVGMSLFRNYGKEVGLMSWLNDYIWPVEDKLIEEDVYVGSLLSFVEMIKNGITTIADMYFFSEATIKAAQKIGIRAEISRGLSVPDQDDYRLKEAISLKEKYKDDDLIEIGLGPHAVYTVDFDYLKKVSDLAYKYDMPIHIHLSETIDENKGSIERFNMTPTEVFDKAGIFDHRTIAAHGVHLTDNDLNILKEKNVSIIHNPSSNMKLASGFLDLGRLIDKGLNIGLGTDSSASNNKLSMIKEMELAGLISKLKSSTDVSAYEILEMATINGAKALGKDMGRVEEGALADLIIIELNNANHTPENNLVSSLVYSTYDSDIKYTIINGQLVYDKGKIAGLKLDEIYKKARKSSKRLGL